jgi:hypothetical protein
MNERERREKIRVKNAEYTLRSQKRMSDQEYAKREQERLRKAELKKLEEAGEWVCKLPEPVEKVEKVEKVEPETVLDLSIVDSMQDIDIKWTKQKIDWSEE